jgi:hypothetical protein
VVPTVIVGYCVVIPRSQLRDLPAHQRAAAAQSGPPEPGRLVAVDVAPDFYASGWSQGRHRVFTWPQADAMGRRQQALEGMLAFGTARFNLSRGGEAR